MISIGGVARAVAIAFGQPREGHRPALTRPALVQPGVFSLIGPERAHGETVGRGAEQSDQVA